MTILEPKKEKYIFLNIYFCSKMLNFQDFSKFSKILKSSVQYLFRDISNVKIGQFLRQSRKKHWKTLFCPTAFKIKKIKKFDIPSHKFFEYLSSKKKILKIGPPQIGVWRGSLAVDTLLCPYLYIRTHNVHAHATINCSYSGPGHLGWRHQADKEYNNSKLRLQKIHQTSTDIS